MASSGKRGDATLERIANLADGWSVRATSEQTLEVDIDEEPAIAAAASVSPVARGKPVTGPPPRAKRPSENASSQGIPRPPPTPMRSSAKSSPPSSRALGSAALPKTTALPIKKVGSGSGSNRVPVNEFGQTHSGRGEEEQNAAAAAAGFSPPTPGPAVAIRARTDVTLVDPPGPDRQHSLASSTMGNDDTLRTSNRGATFDGDGQGRSHGAPGGTLRVIPKLPQRKGVIGDVGYVFTALLGVSRLRRESSRLELAQAKRLQLRKTKLLVLGKSAVTDDNINLPDVVTTRNNFVQVEERRSQLAGQVAASVAERDQVVRDRSDKAKVLTQELAALEKRLSELNSKMGPIEKEFSQAKKRANEMRDTLQRIDDKISETESTVVSVKTARQDRAAVSAEIATLKADRVAVARDEPVIAARLDELMPRMAGFESELAAVNTEIVTKKNADLEDCKRCDEMTSAIAARKVVQERSLADSEEQRNRLFLALGEHLSVERPDDFVTDLVGLDALDIDIGTADRRLMELRDVLSTVDRWKIVRGSVVLLIVLLAIVAAVLWFLAFSPRG